MSIKFNINKVIAGLALGAGSMSLFLTHGDAAIGRVPVQATHRQVSNEILPTPDLTIRLEPEQSLTEALTDRGVAHLDAALVDVAAATSSFASTRPVKVWLGPQLRDSKARMVERLQGRTLGGRLFTIVRHGDDFLPTLTNLTIDDTPVRFRLRVQRNLRATLANAGLSDKLSQQVSRLADEHGGAAIDLIISHEEWEHRSSFGEPLYLGITMSNGQIRRWIADSKGGLRGVAAASSASQILQRPVAGSITSGMGLRFHPILRYFRLHKGVDFAASTGTPVRAAQTGRVIHAGWSGGYGRTVRIQHEDGSITLYAHLQTYEVDVGEMVSQGTAVGSVGATGLATGPHLHFEWTRNGKPRHPSFTTQPLDGSHEDALHSAVLKSVLGAPFREPPARS